MPTLPEHLRPSALGGETLSREALSAHQRLRVLEAAITVFARRGYQGTTVEDLLQAGHVGDGNFYSLFEGKEDCFLAAFDLVVARAKERMAIRQSALWDWAEQTYIDLLSLLETMQESPLAGRLVLLEAQSGGARAMARYNGLLDGAIAWLARGREFGGADLPPSYEHAAITGLAFYLQQCVLDPSSHDLDSLIDEISVLLLQPMIGSRKLAAVRRSVADGAH